MNSPIYCCCNCGCCCRCCHYPEKEGSRCCKYATVIVFLTAGTAVVALSIAGIVYGAKISDKYDKFKCSAFLFVNEAL